MQIIKLLLIFLGLVVLLLLRFHFVFQPQYELKTGQVITFEQTLLSEPRIVGRFQAFSATIQGYNRVTVYVPTEKAVHYGDSVRITGTVKERLINNEKTVKSIYSDRIERINTQGSLALAPLRFIRQKLVSSFERTLPPASSTLLLGIVFGIKGEFSKEFQKDLQRAGILHIIAASGMNVTLVAFFLGSVLTFFLPKRTALFISILGIWVYAFFSGFQASIIRASIMGSFASGAVLLGRQNLALYSIILTTYVMLFWSPTLLFDIGFQLSVTSTLGLLLLPPIFTKNSLISYLLSKLKVLEDGLVTICSQLVTLPIILANFSSYSVWSITVNFLVLWTIPILMVLGGISALCMFFIPPLGQLGLYLCLPFLLYIQFIVELFGGREEAITIDTLPISFIISYYLFLIAFILYFRKKHYEKS